MIEMMECFRNWIMSLSLWQILLMMFLAVNLKSLPLVFHYRIFRPIVQRAFGKKIIHRAISVRHEGKNLPLVFLPCITTTYTPLLEADYNLHKSNSTYFTDLDASRSHLLSTLCYSGVSIVDKELTSDGKRGIMAAIIGSVTTSFKKEIRIFQRYEVWSRILTWDKKWLYIVTHFVQKGSVRHHCLRPDTSSSGNAFEKCCISDGRKQGSQGVPAVVCATSVSKYVFKKGRFTVAPERIMRASGLLGASEKSSKLPTGIPPSLVTDTTDETPKQDDDQGTFAIEEAIENERLRGIRYAEAWGKLDSLHEEMDMQKGKSNVVPVIGHFSDITGYGVSYS